MSTAKSVPAKPRRRWRWFLLALLLIAGGLGGALWWALDTNQLGQVIERAFRDRLPAHLTIAATEVKGLEQVVLTGVSLQRDRAAPPAVSVERITIQGDLWKGHVDRVRIENMRVFASADAVRFLHEVIKAELAIKATGTPRLLKLEIDGDVMMDGVAILHADHVEVDAIGSQTTVRSHGRAFRDPARVEVDTEGQGDALRYRITLSQSMLPVKEVCARLAALELVAKLPEEAARWLPDTIDVSSSVVIADNEWEHFTGMGKAKWKSGHALAMLAIDNRQVRLDGLTIADEGLGTLEGGLTAGLRERNVEVNATSWKPGPRIPIPAVVPAAAILAVLPQAVLKARDVPGGWDMAVQLNGSGQQGVLAWAPGKPFTIDGTNIPLSLLQSFLPSELTLAAGRAQRLHVVIDDGGLAEFTAEVEQTRALWAGWALGTVDGKVAVRPLRERQGGFDAAVGLGPLGSMRYVGDARAGVLTVDLPAAESFIVRLKGPSKLPDLHGAVAFETTLQRDGDVLTGELRRLGLGRIELPDLLRGLDAKVDGRFRLRAGRLDADLSGQLSSCELLLFGTWRDLAKRRPIFTARVVVTGDAVLAEQVLVRATDERGEPLPDGYSAGIRGRYATTEQSGLLTGVADHADLGWLTGVIPIPDGRLLGECAVTFEAEIAPEGVRRVDGFFMPLDADLALGPSIRAKGITGAVKFHLGSAALPKP